MTGTGFLLILIGVFVAINASNIVGTIGPNATLSIGQTTITPTAPVATPAALGGGSSSKTTSGGAGGGF